MIVDNENYVLEARKELFERRSAQKEIGNVGKDEKVGKVGKVEKVKKG